MELGLLSDCFYKGKCEAKSCNWTTPCFSVKIPRHCLLKADLDEVAISLSSFLIGKKGSNKMTISNRSWEWKGDE